MTLKIRQIFDISSPFFFGAVGHITEIVTPEND